MNISVNLCRLSPHTFIDIRARLIDWPEAQSSILRRANTCGQCGLEEAKNLHTWRHPTRGGMGKEKPEISLNYCDKNMTLKGQFTFPRHSLVGHNREKKMVCSYNESLLISHKWGWQDLQWLFTLKSDLNKTISNWIWILWLMDTPQGSVETLYLLF